MNYERRIKKEELRKMNYEFENTVTKIQFQV